MWYVIQVVGGQEEQTAELIGRQVEKEVLKECFIPKKERVKKFRGRWQQVEEILFPGYVFTVSEQPEELFLRLKQVTRLTKLLQDGAFHFIPLSREEEQMICSIGDNRHVTRLSTIQIEEAEQAAPEEPGRLVRILDGPLKDQKGRIVKYDLHKREVIVRLPFMGNEVDLRLGIQMVGERVPGQE